MASKLIWFIGICVVCYAGLNLLMFVMQARFIYFPSQPLAFTPADAGLEYEDVWLTTEDDVRIHGWYVPAAEAQYTVLFLHGNGGNISHRVQTLEIFHRLGLNTLIIDYRGYGRSAGKPSETGTYRDAMAAWHFLVRNRTEADNIILFGRSLGGAVALWLATSAAHRGLVLESTFTSLADMAAYHYPLLPVRYLLRYRYDNLSRVGRLTTPVLVVHSAEDRIVPFSQGQRLYTEVPAIKTFLQIEGGHNDGFLASGKRYVNGLQDFVGSL